MCLGEDETHCAKAEQNKLSLGCRSSRSSAKIVNLGCEMVKFLYIHVNKCGGTSVKSALKGVPSVLIPANNDILNNIDKGSYVGLTKFTIVRNPIERFKSLVRMIWRDKDEFLSADSIAEIVMDESVEFRACTDLARYIKRHGLPISHPHYGVIYNGSVYMDHVFKLENIDNDWGSICKLIGVKKSLPRKNDTRGVKKEVLLSDEIRKRLIAYYEGDFLHFGYQVP